MTAREITPFQKCTMCVLTVNRQKMPDNLECLEVVPLHHHPELMDSCADLLNQQWSRSKTARLHSLGKSCDALPCSLVLVTAQSQAKNEQPRQVIGHSMLSQVIAMDEACFVESVLVDPRLRGKGLGRRLMEESEDYAASLGYRKVYLSTHDKQGFYGHLGYEFCEPISKLDSCTKLLPVGLLKHLGTSSSAQPKAGGGESVKKTTEPKALMNRDTHPAVGSPLKNPPPPPVPPLVPPPAAPPANGPHSEIQRTESNQISWMKKELSKK